MKNTDEALAELIRKGIETAEKTGELVIDQAPELIQQFYTWHIAQNIFGTAVGFLMLLLVYKIVLSGKEKESWSHDVNISGKWITFYSAFLCFFLSLLGLIFLFVSAYYLIYILTAPNLFLIEYFIK